MNDKTDNKEIILNTSLNLFSSKGYESAGVQEIAEQSGITKPTLYHYFGSKKGLLEALIDRYFVKLISEIKVSAKYNGDLPLTLHRIVKSYFNFAQSNPDFYRLHLALYYGPPKSESSQLVINRLIKLHEILVDTFESAVKDHGNMRGRSQSYAASLSGMINTYIGLMLNGLLELNEEVIFRAVHQFMHGIYS